MSYGDGAVGNCASSSAHPTAVCSILIPNGIQHVIVVSAWKCFPYQHSAEVVVVRKINFSPRFVRGVSGRTLIVVKCNAD
jgi:hypothetical protein